MKTINIKRVIASTEAMQSDQSFQHIKAELTGRPYTEVIDEEVIVILSCDFDSLIATISTDQILIEEQEEQIKELKEATKEHLNMYSNIAPCSERLKQELK